MKNLSKILFSLPIVLVSCSNSQEEKPNLIFIITDDQGYGDMACHGNPWIKTPHIDKLESESISFSNFHVGTTCTPSRAGLLSGKYSNKVGAWHTVNGRSLLSSEVSTLADVFKEAGYKTAMFGKWHLGDNYPFRPHDRGFDEALYHGGGAIGNTPDYWNNDYFDDTYYRNGIPEEFTGYCNDIWFEESIKYIEENKNHPFFIYLTTNVPHGPYHVEERYSNLYSDNPNITNPNFYGMITNIDENLGKLRKALEDMDLSENTILIYMTDNGTAEGVKFNENGEVISGYNAGMRGIKGSPYDGGHRVPFFIHWPSGNISTEKTIPNISSYIDFMPTVLDLCGISTDLNFDGISLKPLIQGNESDWEERVLFTDTQREDYLVKWKQFSAMTDRWRLVNKDELYDIRNDPGQKTNLADKYPEVVDSLISAYELWWEDVSKNAHKYNHIKVGTPHENPVRLTGHDFHADKGLPIWNQHLVRSGDVETGFWAVEIVQSGEYEFDLRRWPEESKLKLCDPAPKGEEVPGNKDYSVYNVYGQIAFPYPKGKALALRKARLSIGEKKFEKAIDCSDYGTKFKINMEKGTYKLWCSFIDSSDVERSAYYVYVDYLNTLSSYQ